MCIVYHPKSRPVLVPGDRHPDTWKKAIPAPVPPPKGLDNRAGESGVNTDLAHTD